MKAVEEQVLTDAGWDEVASTAPAHVAEVRRLVLDPLTKTRVQQLHEMAEQIRQVARPAGWLPPPAAEQP
ncbi:hypothetical protein [Modestobacter sp. URMC 112]